MRTEHVRSRRWRGCAPLVVVTACIIPDSGAIVRSDFGNPGAVRIVEPIALTERANEACAEAEPGLVACPMPLPTQPLGLIDFPNQPFCRCPPPERDGNALGSVEIFVEDPDVDDERGGVPKDALFGAFLLDVPPDFDALYDDPSEYLAYANYLPPTAPAQVVPLLLDFSYRDSIGRANLHLKSWMLAPELGSVDLCNNDDGERLAPGIHTLRLVVTDRPWYVPVVRDDEGAVVRDDDGRPVRASTEPLFGVPDLAAGATYATTSIVFRCGDGTVEESGCNCIQPQGGV